jgi:zinc protease
MKNMLLGLTAVYSLLLPAASSAVTLVPMRAVLDNGIVLLTSEQKTLPMVSIELLIDAGSRYDPPKREGLANLTAGLLTYGTRTRTALQISDTLDYLGAFLSTDCSQDLASVSMTILKKDLPTGLELLADILTNSTFPEAEIERQKQAVIASIRAREESPGDIAQRRFAGVLYPQSPYGRPVEGAESSVEAIPQQSLREFYQRYYRPNRAILAVVGDVSHQEIATAIDQAFARGTKASPGANRRRPPSSARARRSECTKI